MPEVNAFSNIPINQIPHDTIILPIEFVNCGLYLLILNSSC